MENKYSINVAWSDEDNCFVATIPEFPNLSAFGGTQEEAVGDAKVVLQMAIESLSEDGIAPPQPQKITSYSGQVRLRMPRSLHAKLASESKKDGVSLNTYMVTLLASKSTAEKVYTQTVNDLRSFIDQHEKNMAEIVEQIGVPAEEDISTFAYTAFSTVNLQDETSSVYHTH
ncbi:MAG: toxin-antitoxin system HicB family antitoxin [Desulfobulbaceae bacterium]|nr:toxin-antitoxin system HicB family antitoxin [Desulfobulbaceae bacterium]